MEKQYSFAVEDVQKIVFEDYSDEEFAIARLGFLSTRPNTHKLNISEEVFRKCASSVLGKFVVADVRFADATTHTQYENIKGYVPRDQDVEFVKDDDGYLRGYVDAVISKVYAPEFYQLFETDNLRSVSVEMKVSTPPDDEEQVDSFNIVGVTVLGKNVNPSCPESDMKIIRFSEKEAEKFFDKIHSDRLAAMKNFVEERKNSMADKKSYKIDKSRDAMSETPWGEVDKTELRKKIMEASNRDSLVHDVYMLVEDGWEDAPSEKLKYPVMEIKGDKVVYNRDGLASALGYAKKENETGVIRKVEEIYKKLKIDEDKEDDAKMAEIEGRKAWGLVIRKVQDHEGKGVYVDSIEDDHIIYTKGDVRYRVDAEVKVDPDDKTVDAKIDWNTVKKDKDQKMAEDVDEEVRHDEEEVNREEEKREDEDDHDDDDDRDEEFARLKKEIEQRDHIIMGKDKELEELRKFKKEVQDKEKNFFIEKTMEEVKECLSKEQMEELRKEGNLCEYDGIDAWANKVKATSFENTRKEKNKDTFWSFAAPVNKSKETKTGSIWDRI